MIKLHLKYLLVILLLTVIMICIQSCSTIRVIPMDDLNILSKSEYSSFDEAEHLVIKNEAVLQSIYDRIVPKDTIPQISWNESQVVLLSMGPRNTGGYTISVNKVVYDTSEILVYYRTTGPKSGTMVTQALTAPYVLFTIYNKKDLPVVFKEEKE